jgi:integrase
MAHVEKRGDRWRARYRAPGGRERSRTFTRKIDAERWNATQTADVARGQWVDPQKGRMTFAEWAARWQTGLHDYRPTTRALNLGILRNHLLPRFGHYPLTSITTSDVNQLVADDVASGRFSSSAVRRHVIVLRVVLEGALVDGRVGRNAAAGVKLPPESARDMRFLEPDQVARLADAIRPEHYRPLIYTAAYVGLRWGELAGLARESVDPLRKTIKVERQLVDVGSELTFGPPKTRRGKRTVSMPAAIADMLAEHMASDIVRSNDLVFPTVRGRPMRRSHFRKTFRAAVDRASFSGGPLDGLVFHELRHTAAALAIAQGAHPLAIRDRLGHSSITTTMDTYGGLFPSLDEAIAEGLDGMLRDSLAASSRPEASNVARLRRSE